MTIANSYDPTKVSGDGVTLIFSFDFRIYESDDLVVKLINKTTLVETDQVNGVDYTVSINLVTEGGTITYITAPPATVWSFIESGLDDTQPTSFPLDAKLREKSIETMGDRITRLVQQSTANLGRSLAFRADTDLSSIDTTVPVPKAGKLLGWNDDGKALMNYDQEEIDTSQIADGAVTTVKLDDLAATKAKIGADAIDASKIEADAVDTAALDPRYKFSEVEITDEATLATDASLGCTFYVTLGDDRTLGAPTNPLPGQKVVWRFVQDGIGSRLLSLNAIFRISDDIDLGTITLSTAVGAVDYLGAVYNAQATKWDIVAFAKDVS